jgi:hypothetical protein
MEYLAEFFSTYLEYVQSRLVPFLDSNSRIFSLYLLTSGLIAFLIYRGAQRKMIAD